MEAKQREVEEVRAQLDMIRGGEYEKLVRLRGIQAGIPADQGYDSDEYTSDYSDDWDSKHTDPRHERHHRNQQRSNRHQDPANE